MVCANDEFIGDAYKDPDGLWIGESPLPMVIFYNKDLIEKDGLTIPESWEDLTKPEWKGKIAYCLPSKSGPHTPALHHDPWTWRQGSRMGFHQETV